MGDKVDLRGGGLNYHHLKMCHPDPYSLARHAEELSPGAVLAVDDRFSGEVTGPKDQQSTYTWHFTY